MQNQNNMLIFEVGTEELPVSYFTSARKELEDSANTALSQARLSFKELKVIGTPRRLTLIVSELHENQSPKAYEVRGPAKQAAYDQDGNPTKALLGFAKSQGVTPDSVIIRDDAGKEYIFAKIDDPGKPAVTLLPEILQKLILSLSFPKVMRWEDESSNTKNDILFARPIRWLFCLYGDEIIPVKIGKLFSSSFTEGHRFLHPAPIKINHVSQYQSALKNGYVIVDQSERKEQIKKELAAHAKNANGNLCESAYGSLLEELTYLVEYPSVFKGTFEERFLALPPEVLTTVMVHHQRYLPLESISTNKLLPAFLGVRNGNEDHIKTVIAGNERVLGARLADAVYFFNKDKEIPLKERVKDLDRVVFQKDLGTYGAKIKRIEKLCNWLIKNVKILKSNKVFSLEEITGDQDISKNVSRTALLCKADLTTQMVFELPELQGVMGRIYAEESDEKDNVAKGIEEHYLPRGADSKMPETIEGIIVGLADRADTLSGCFGLGIIPSGSRDPYGLRRAVLGIINIALHHNIIMNFKELFQEAFQCYLDENVIKQEGCDNGKQALREFVLGRIESELLLRFQAESKQNDLSRFMLESVYPCGEAKGIKANLADTVNKISVISSSRKNQPEEFTRQVMAAVRIANIIDKHFYDEYNTIVKPNPELFIEQEEKALDTVRNDIERSYNQALDDRKFHNAWNILYQLISPINNFFDKVLVMDPNESLRQNRIRLLGAINLMFEQFGDLSKIILE